MRIDRTQLEAAAQRGIISASQAGALWTFLEAQQAGTPQFSFNHLLYYFGGMLAIGGISAFVTLGWETLGGMGLLLVALRLRDLLAHRLLLGAEALEGGEGRSTALVGGEHGVDDAGVLTPGTLAGAHRVGVLPEQPDVDHPGTVPTPLGPLRASSVRSDGPSARRTARNSHEVGKRGRA